MGVARRGAFAEGFIVSEEPERGEEQLCTFWPHVLAVSPTQRVETHGAVSKPREPLGRLIVADVLLDHRLSDADAARRQTNGLQLLGVDPPPDGCNMAAEEGCYLGSCHLMRLG